MDDLLVCGAALERLPYRDAAFQYLVCDMVFEHLEDPEHVVEELARVSAPGARMLVHTVNGRHYLAILGRLTSTRVHRWVVARLEGRKAVDVYPTWYRANSEARLRRLFQSAGCRQVWGGVVADLPIYAPYRLLFWPALFFGLLEIRLGGWRGLGAFLRPNLLLEFERI